MSGLSAEISPRKAHPKGKVIVVDGEPVVRSAVKAILEYEGYSVHATEDIRSAIESCKNDTPDLILTNVLLPGITGHDAMKLVKQNCPGIPVLMISGLPASPTIGEWIKEDGFDVFPKPFQARDLIRKIDETLGYYRNQRAG